MENNINNEGTKLGVAKNIKRNKKLRVLHTMFIPSECTLVKEGLFPGVRIKGGGFKILLPWTRTTVLTNNFIPLDPVPMKLPCKSNYDVTIDIVLTLYIDDFEQFYRENTEGYVKDLIMDRLEEKLRTFVASRTYEELQYICNHEPIINLDEFSDVIQSIEEDFGVTVSKFGFQRVEQPEYIKRAVEQRKEAEERNKAMQAEAENRKRIANTDRETENIKMETKIVNTRKYIKALVEELRVQGLDDNVIRDYLMANIKNGTVINVVGGQSSGISDGINFQAGMSAANNINQNDQGRRRR